MAKLTNLQKEFINQYFICGRNATQAVIDAGYKINEPDSSKGRATAAAIGYENLRKPQIREQVEARLKEHAMSANEVIARLSDFARGDLTFLLNADGEPDLAKAKSYGVTHLIKEYEIETTRYVDPDNIEIAKIVTKSKLKIHDALSALVHLGRYHKLFTDKVELTDWRVDAIRDIRAGLIPYEDVEEELGTDLATELFRSAGIPVMAE